MAITSVLWLDGLMEVVTKYVSNSGGGGRRGGEEGGGEGAAAEIPINWFYKVCLYNVVKERPAAVSHLSDKKTENKAFCSPVGRRGGEAGVVVGGAGGTEQGQQQPHKWVL